MVSPSENFPSALSIERLTVVLAMALRNLQRSQFEVIRTIGVGSFSHVDLCIHRPTQCVCVLKVMSKQKLIELEQIEHIQHERALIELVQHPNVVVFYGSFQDAFNVYMMLEYIPGGEVFSHLRTMGQFDLNTVRFYGA